MFSMFIGKKPEEFAGYIVEKTVGKGKCGTVYLAHPKENPDQKVCLKFDTSKERAQQELAAADDYFKCKAGEAYDIQCAVYEIAPNKHMLVLPYVEGTTLDKTLQNKIGANEARALAISFLKEIALLNALGWFQRDIKLDNMMVKDCNITLIDFGFSLNFLNKGSIEDLSFRNAADEYFWVTAKIPGANTFILNYFGDLAERIAPENREVPQGGTSKIGKRSEAYSAGFILKKIREAVSSEDKDHPGLKELDTIIEGLLAKDPMERMSVEEALKTLNALDETYKYVRQAQITAKHRSETSEKEAFTEHPLGNSRKGYS